MGNPHKHNINQTYGRALRQGRHGARAGAVFLVDMSSEQIQREFQRMYRARLGMKATRLAAKIDSLVAASRVLVGINRKIVVDQAHDLSAELTRVMGRIADA